MRIAKFRPTRAALFTTGTAVFLTVASLARPVRLRAQETVRQPSADASKAAQKAPHAAKAQNAIPRPPTSIELSASGRVLDADGRPMAGATVLIREWAIDRTMGMPRKYADGLVRGQEIEDILAEMKTDEKGEFRFVNVITPPFYYPEADRVGKTVFPWDVIAYARGHGVAWTQLTPRNQRVPISLTLPLEGTLRGRLVEPDGKPIAGARVKVFGIDPLGNVDPHGSIRVGRLNLTWSSVPLGAISGAEGRFVLGGLPRDTVAVLVVTEPHHQRTVFHAATTNVPQDDLTLTRRVDEELATEMERIYTGEFTITIKRFDGRLAGRVVFASSGKPAPATLVSVRQRYVTEADADGRFVVDGLPPGEVELHLYAPNTDAVPLETRLTISDKTDTITQEFALPPGLIVKGGVVDQDARKGIAGAELIYRPRRTLGQARPADILKTKTDADGRFRLAVPAGPGAIEIWGLPAPYPNAGAFAPGSNADPLLKQQIDGKPGASVDLTFRLEREKPVTLTVVDPDGQPVSGAEVYHRGRRVSRLPPLRTDAGGRCELMRFDRENGATFDVFHPSQPLGARVVIRPEGLDAERTAGKIDVKLERTARMIGRVIDEDGKPIVAPLVRVSSVLPFPERATSTVASTSETRADGSFRFDGLIAGVRYSLMISADGRPTLLSEPISPKAGEVVQLNDFRLPAAKEELSGVVVDSGGKPVAGITILSRSAAKSRLILSPAHVGFRHETDSHGRFHLIDLPKGPLTLTAVRQPTEDSGNKRTVVTVEVEVGNLANELRIVLPDPNARLRGIE